MDLPTNTDLRGLTYSYSGAQNKRKISERKIAFRSGGIISVVIEDQEQGIPNFAWPNAIGHQKIYLL